MADIVNLTANIKDLNQDLERHERFAVTFKDSPSRNANAKEDLGRWNGIIEAITNAKTEFTKISLSIDEMKGNLNANREVLHEAKNPGTKDEKGNDLDKLEHPRNLGKPS